MVNLLKTFAKGILYIIGLPFFLVALLLFGVVGLFLFLFQLIKSVIYFFTGQKFFPELPEDKELKLRKEAAYAMNNPQEAPQPQPQQDNQSIIYPYVEQEPEPEPIIEEPEQYYTIEEACFNDPEVELEQEENVFEDLMREEPQVEEPLEEQILARAAVSWWRCLVSRSPSVFVSCSRDLPTSSSGRPITLRRSLHCCLS